MWDRDPAAREARALLGVSPDADAAQIVRAYRRRARVVHPDVSTEQGAAAQFSALRAAYQLLLGTAPEPESVPDRDDHAPIAEHRPTGMPARHPVTDSPARWANRGVAWLLAGPVRVEPPGGTTVEPGHE
jgi:hypothetical protein